MGLLFFFVVLSVHAHRWTFPFTVLQEIVDAVLTIKEGDQPIDLFMVEVMTMLHKTETDTK